MSDALMIDSCVRGYHYYQDVWDPVIGEQLECVQEPANLHDRYAVAVLKEETVVGHVPRKISIVCCLFLRRGGTIVSTITGTRHYSHDLAQGGMEVPCTLNFRCDSKKLQQLTSKLLKQMPEDILLVPSSQSFSQYDEQKYIPPATKAIKILEVEETVTNTCDADDIWVTYNRVTLKHSDKKIIEDGSQLTDKHIRLAQMLIRGQFPKIGGLQSTLLQERCHNLPSNSIQAVHCLKRHHWIVASNVLSASGHVHIYSLLFST